MIPFFLFVHSRSKPPYTSYSVQSWNVAPNLPFFSCGVLALHDRSREANALWHNLCPYWRLSTGCQTIFHEYRLLFCTRTMVIPDPQSSPPSPRAFIELSSTNHSASCCTICSSIFLSKVASTVLDLETTRGISSGVSVPYWDWGSFLNPWTHNLGPYFYFTKFLVNSHDG